MKPRTLRIGTWNVQYAAGRERNALRTERLRREPADVWILTETHDDLDLSSSHSAVSTVQRPTGRAGGRWTTIWTRWPVLEVLPDAALVVAGDLNMSLGGKHYYGTKRGRAALQQGLAELGLACATEWARLPSGLLTHSPIDHVVVPANWLPRTTVVDAWEGTDPAGQKLSDHSGLLVEVELQYPLLPPFRPFRPSGHPSRS